MSHTKSVRPSSRASRGRAGRPPSIIFEAMAGVVSPSNGSPLVKTLGRVQMLDEPSIPLPSTLNVARHGDKPLLQPFQKQTRPLHMLLHLLPPESLGRSMPQCTRWPAPRGSFHEQSKRTRNPSNERGRGHRRGYWTSQVLPIGPNCSTKLLTPLKFPCVMLFA